MHVLICGGAGYIGSHMVKLLAEQGYSVTIFDNLSTGHREAVKWGTLVQGDLLDTGALEALFKSNQFDAVMHFSAKSLVGESVEKPALYYLNNVIGSYNLLEQMRLHDVNKFVFSSTAATFGNPQTATIDESHPQVPINPYGRTKLAVEYILGDYAQAYGLRSVSLRYFNAAGADPSGMIGESHDPETHLIPNVLKAVLGAGSNLRIFGDDYDTADGTCIRDYIHVNDLCEAHLLALKYMDTQDGAQAYNLGNGKGFSVLEVLNAAMSVVGKKIPYEIVERRPGDPATLVANSQLVTEQLNWKPVFTQIDEIINTAWNWHNNSSY